ncbi:MarR family winged helix-turn-helix transcriptional regulator [Nocardia sp. CS682]|uniref:MarR family winged helix-turn-helix transcriptional regulator n=1 Tax=Nocardia sp. CS682 TaxID=1047172 RepID=UPI0010754ABD|nr:MarR family winged helix-turn-helix transcriptional regulator [Nocardia sp. CS682]QBS43494.1 MarR family transcriptional regulator [Nocardia sp. CS682]
MEWLSDDEQATWSAYIRLRQRLDAAIAEGLTRDGLSAADYELMVALSAAPGDCLRAKDLAAEVCWEKSRLSKHLARMDARGLVDRQPVAEDARGVLVKLTAEGRRLLEHAAPNHVRLVREVFIDCITPDEARALQSLSDKVLVAVEESTHAALGA